MTKTARQPPWRDGSGRARDAGPAGDGAGLRATVTDDFPTARTMLRQDAWLCLLVWCKACHHQRVADLQAIIDVGRGDVPLKDLKFRCAQCGSWSSDALGKGRGRGAAVASDGVVAFGARHYPPKARLNELSKRLGGWELRPPAAEFFL